MDQVGQIIKNARKAKGMSQKTLGEKVGVSQPAIRKIELGGAAGGTQHSRFLPRISQVLDIPWSQLDSALEDQEQTEDEPPQQVARPAVPDFPIRGSVEAGPGIITITEDPVDYIERPPQLAYAEDAYGVYVTGTSMEPEYRPGDTALVHPYLPIVFDEVYVFYAELDGETRATIKHLRKATPDKWFLTQHNPPDGSSKDFVLLRKEWQTAHRVLGRFRPR